MNRNNVCATVIVCTVSSHTYEYYIYIYNIHIGTVEYTNTIFNNFLT